MASEAKRQAFASATVTVTIKVISSGHWDEKATIGEVMEIGARETKNAIREALRTSRLNYEIIGEMKVGAVTWERDRD